MFAWDWHLPRIVIELKPCGIYRAVIWNLDEEQIVLEVEARTEGLAKSKILTEIASWVSKNEHDQ